MTVAACGSTYSEALEAEWSVPHVDPKALKGLAIASSRMRTPGMLTTVRGVISSGSKSPPVRRAAMEAASGWIDPCVVITLTRVHVVDEYRFQARVSTVQDCSRGFGPSGRDTEEGRGIIALLDRVRVDDPDPDLRDAAAAVAMMLKVTNPVKTPS